MIGTLVGYHLRWLTGAREVLATALLAVGAVALAGLLALHDAREAALAAAAVVWLVASVGGLLAGARVVAAEHAGGGLRGVLLAPIDRRDLFLARALVVAGLVTLAHVLALGLVAVLFPELPGRLDPQLLATAGVAGLGLGPVGTLAGWASLSTDVGELLATGLALPLAAPLVVGGLHATETLLAAGTGWEASLTFATGYALSVGALCYAVSEPVAEVA